MNKFTATLNQLKTQMQNVLMNMINSYELQAAINCYYELILILYGLLISSDNYCKEQVLVLYQWITLSVLLFLGFIAIINKRIISDTTATTTTTTTTTTTKKGIIGETLSFKNIFKVCYDINMLFVLFMATGNLRPFDCYIFNAKLFSLNIAILCITIVFPIIDIWVIPHFKSKDDTSDGDQLIGDKLTGILDEMTDKINKEAEKEGIDAIQLINEKINTLSVAVQMIERNSFELYFNLFYYYFDHKFNEYLRIACYYALLTYFFDMFCAPFRISESVQMFAFWIIFLVFFCILLMAFWNKAMIRPQTPSTESKEEISYDKEKDAETLETEKHTDDEHTDAKHTDALILETKSKKNFIPNEIWAFMFGLSLMIAIEPAPLSNVDTFSGGSLNTFVAFCLIISFMGYILGPTLYLLYCTKTKIEAKDENIDGTVILVVSESDEIDKVNMVKMKKIEQVVSDSERDDDDNDDGIPIIIMNKPVSYDDVEIIYNNDIPQKENDDDDIPIIMVNKPVSYEDIDEHIDNKDINEIEIQQEAVKSARASDIDPDDRLQTNERILVENESNKKSNDIAARADDGFPRTRHSKLTLMGLFDELQQNVNDTNSSKDVWASKGVWAKGVIKVMMNTAMYPQLTNIVIGINNVGRGSIIIDYSLQSDTVELLDLAEKNINSATEILFSNPIYTFDPWPTIDPTEIYQRIYVDTDEMKLAELRRQQQIAEQRRIALQEEAERLRKLEEERRRKQEEIAREKERLREAEEEMERRAAEEEEARLRRLSEEEKKRKRMMQEQEELEREKQRLADLHRKAEAERQKELEEQMRKIQAEKDKLAEEEEERRKKAEEEEEARRRKWEKEEAELRKQREEEDELRRQMEEEQKRLEDERIWLEKERERMRKEELAKLKDEEERAALLARQKKEVEDQKKRLAKLKKEQKQKEKQIHKDKLNKSLRDRRTTDDLTQSNILRSNPEQVAPVIQSTANQLQKEIQKDQLSKNLRGRKELDKLHNKNIITANVAPQFAAKQRELDYGMKADILKDKLDDAERPKKHELYKADILYSETMAPSLQSNAKDLEKKMSGIEYKQNQYKNEDPFIMFNYKPSLSTGVYGVYTLKSTYHPSL